jgi:catechol 2,3-dioxygenase-like lactoylglutathione lyase family enzyme
MTSASPSISAICPQLPVADVRLSADWYGRALGFEVRYQDENTALLSRDGCELHIWRCDNPAIAEVSSAYIRTSDLDALFATMAGAGAGGRIRAPADRSWGMREFYVWDLDGNLLKFGQPIKVAAE